VENPEKDITIVAVGTQAAGEEGDKAFNSLVDEAKTYKGNINIIILYLDTRQKGKGRQLHWAFDIANTLNQKAPNLHLDADLYTQLDGVSSREEPIDWSSFNTQQIEKLMAEKRLAGLSPYWIKALVGPVLEGADLAIPDYRRAIKDGFITKFIMYIWAKIFYRVSLQHIIAGDFCLSGRFIKMLLKDRELKVLERRRFNTFGYDNIVTSLARIKKFVIHSAYLGGKNCIMRAQEYRREY